MVRSVIHTTPGKMGRTVAKLTAELVKANAKAAQDAFFMAAQMGKTEVIEQIDNTRPHAPVDTGTMRNGYQVRRLAIGAELVNPEPTAAFMEFGTRPHTPPLDALRLWASRKLRGMGKPGAGRQGPRKRLGRGERERAIEALARAAQRSIAKRGIKARGFHARASKRFAEFIHKALLFQLARVRGR